MIKSVSCEPLTREKLEQMIAEEKARIAKPPVLREVMMLPEQAERLYKALREEKQLAEKKEGSE